MQYTIIQSLLDGNNNPPEGKVIFDSTDHVRFQNGNNVSGHNFGCNRRITIEKNIQGGEGYTATMYNQDVVHPLWGNNVQMAPKQMKIVNVQDNIIELRGFGFDRMGAPFANYGLLVSIESNEINRAQLNMFDRNINIVYLK